MEGIGTMKRPIREYYEPYLTYIRRLEAYVDYLESMTTETENTEEQTVETPFIGMLPDLEVGVALRGNPTPTKRYGNVSDVDLLKLLKALDHPLRRKIVEFILNESDDSTPRYKSHVLCPICRTYVDRWSEDEFGFKICIGCIESMAVDVKQ